VFDTVAREMGANIFYTRLRGYGVTTEEITRVRVDDWINDTWEAMEIGHRIGERVIVAGSSMGGDLALWLASRHPAGLGGLVLLSCAVQPEEKLSNLLLWPWPLRNLIVRIVLGKYTSNAFNLDVYPTGNAELMARYNPPHLPHGEHDQVHGRGEARAERAGGVPRRAVALALQREGRYRGHSNTQGVLRAYRWG
jgi:pimeloyl-ACP methyl ester carboxylesterase